MVVGGVGKMIDEEKLKDIMNQLKRLEELNRVLEEMIPLLKLADKLNILKPEYKKLLEVVEEITEKKGEEIITTANNIEEREPVDVINPKTNPKCEIRVFRWDNRIILEWWHANRFVDSVVIKDEWAIYWLMKQNAKRNLLSFSDFCRLIKTIPDFSPVKASLIFNYIGMQSKFKTELKKIKREYGAKEITEWHIEFKPLYEDEFEDRKELRERIKEERKLWQDLLG